MNKIQPQAKALFDARFGEQFHAAQRGINKIKADCNERGLLVSSITVRQIFEYIEAGIAEMAGLAEKCVVLSFEAGRIKVNDDLLRDLLDSFDINFASGYTQLVALAESETSHIRQGLTNSSFLEWGRLPEVMNLAKINAQANLRKYYQDLKRREKRWYEYLPVAGTVLRWMIRS